MKYIFIVVFISSCSKFNLEIKQKDIPKIKNTVTIGPDSEESKEGTFNTFFGCDCYDGLISKPGGWLSDSSSKKQ